MKLTHAMQSYFPAEVLTLLHRSGELAAELDLKLWLIGGSIRDLLLPERPFDWDVDLVVETGGTADIVRRLQAESGGQLQLFKQYGTAKLKFENGLHLDFATARTEFYPHPGANPEVAFSDLHADLDRRDFSVNALAVNLLPTAFGELTDYFQGYQDLQHRRLRALHADKFREDPVRAWRACRLEYSLGFRLEPETADWITTTLNSGLFDGFCSARIRTELRKILSFPDPVPALLRLEALGVLRCLDPELRLNDTLLSALNQLEQWQDWFAEAHDRWAAALCLLLEAIPAPRRLALIPALELNQHQQATWEAFVRQTPVYRETPWPGLSRSEIYAQFKNIPELTLWLWLARFPESPLAQAIELYWQELRHIKPPLSGHDLKALIPPGPHIRRVLNALHRACLDQHITTPAQAWDLAHTLISQPCEVL
jgi:tRNA nucleotidyltransferase (CCA-adding enzyme)